jgi:hypothetical protein
MTEDQENLIDIEKVNCTPHKIKLIYLGILALGIELESTFIPTTKSELDLVIEYLVEILQKKQELIRRGCSLLEQINCSDNTDYYYGMVKDYITKFSQLSRSHPDLSVNIPETEELTIAIKTLTDLLFYSSRSGQNYLKEQLQCL